MGQGTVTTRRSDTKEREDKGEHQFIRSLGIPGTAADVIEHCFTMSRTGEFVANGMRRAADTVDFAANGTSGTVGWYHLDATFKEAFGFVTIVRLSLAAPKVGCLIVWLARCG